MAASYHKALEKSVLANFASNQCINCMCHSTENLYRWEAQLHANPCPDAEIRCIDCACLIMDVKLQQCLPLLCLRALGHRALRCISCSSMKGVGGSVS